MFEKIELILQEALHHFKPSQLGNRDLSRLLQLANEKDPNAPLELASLISILVEVPQLNIFRDSMQVIPGFATRFDYQSLAFWLLELGEKQSSKKALQYLQQYIEAKEITILFVSIIEGIKLSHACQVTKSIRLSPWDDLPTTQQKEVMLRRFITSRTRHPSSLLIHKTVIPKTHVHQDELEATKLFTTYYDHSDVVLCAGLFGPCAPRIAASWLELPEWMPSWGAGYSIPFQTEPSQEIDWPSEGYDSLPKLYKMFKSLDDRKQRYFRVPLERLNTAIRRVSQVDSAIETGIALEALFLSDQNDDRGELTFRLRVRGARYLHGLLESRIAVFRTLGLLYRLRSIAVHTGILPPEIDGHNVGEILNQGYQITANAIIGLINNGIPDWNTLILE
jgi:hypothetical protein